MTDSNQTSKPIRRPIPHLETPAAPLATCEEIARKLPSYRDGSLRASNPRLFGYIKSHLEHCTTCQAANGLAGNETPSK